MTHKGSYNRSVGSFKHRSLGFYWLHYCVSGPLVKQVVKLIISGGEVVRRGERDPNLDSCLAGRLFYLSTEIDCRGTYRQVQIFLERQLGQLQHLFKL